MEGQKYNLFFFVGLITPTVKILQSSSISRSWFNFVFKILWKNKNLGAGRGLGGALCLEEHFSARLQPLLQRRRPPLRALHLQVQDQPRPPLNHITQLLLCNNRPFFRLTPDFDFRLLGLLPRNGSASSLEFCLSRLQFPTLWLHCLQMESCSRRGLTLLPFQSIVEPFF